MRTTRQRAWAVVADGMGGKSGGRKAADQVLLTGRQLFERFAACRTTGRPALKQLVEAHLMIKLTAITAEEEPHSTAPPSAAARPAVRGHPRRRLARLPLPRRRHGQARTTDHSFVQRLIGRRQDQRGTANTHPQSNLLTGCLGTHADPPITLWHIDRLQFGDALLACSDGLWHYFTPKELGAIVHALPREASEMLVTRRASGPAGRQPRWRCPDRSRCR